MVAQLQELANPAKDIFYEFIGQEQRRWEAFVLACDDGFDLCQSPIEQQFYVQWLRVVFEFARIPMASSNALGGWGLSTLVTAPFMWLTLSPQQTIKLDGHVYRVDFLVEIERENKTFYYIVVELDGHDFHERTKEQAKRDKSRDRTLVRHGYSVLRFTGSEIYNNPREAVKDVLRTATRLATR